MPFIEGMCGERTYSKGFGPSNRAYSGCAIDRRTVEQRMTCELATPNRPMFSWRWSRERIATFYHQSQACLPCSIVLLCNVRTFFAICSSILWHQHPDVPVCGIFPHSSAMLNRTRMIGPCQNAAWFFYVPATAPGSSVKRRSVSSLGLEALLLFSPSVWQRESYGLAPARSVILLFALVSERLRASPAHGGDARGGRRHLSVGLLVSP
jgi:hypothetical protein